MSSAICTSDNNRIDQLWILIAQRFAAIQYNLINFYRYLMYVASPYGVALTRDA